MNQQLKICILTDKNSWMNKYNKQLTESLEAEGHQVHCISSKKDISKGDVLFLLSCLEIIPQNILNLNQHNIVVHASDLPQGKGWSPSSWQIYEGKNDIPLTLFEAVEQMDAGDYYLKSVLHLDGSELFDEWRNKLGMKIINMCMDFIHNYSEIHPIPQSGTESFYRKRNAADDELDATKSIASQFNLLRICDNNNFPAYFYLNGHKYSIRITKEQ